MNIRILFFLFLSGCRGEIQKPVEDFSPYKIEVIAIASQSNTDFLETLPVEFNGLYEDDYERSAMVKAALLNDKNDVLWALRGGYGTAKVVEILYDDQEFLTAMRKKKKIPKVIGYCDITALHLFLSQEFNWKPIHGPVFTEVQNNSKKANFKVIKNLLDGVREIKFIDLQPLNDAAHTSQVISGKLTGGNITIIQTSIGTKWEMKAKDKILFLEDCHEKPYKIDRMLNHLKSSKLLDGLKAIIIGNLCDNSDYMEEILRNFAKKMSIPIYAIDVFGHGVYNYPMIYNSDVKISSEDGMKILKQSNL